MTCTPNQPFWRPHLQPELHLSSQSLRWSIYLGGKARKTCLPCSITTKDIWGVSSKLQILSYFLVMIKKKKKRDQPGHYNWPVTLLDTLGLEFKLESKLLYIAGEWLPQIIWKTKKKSKVSTSSVQPLRQAVLAPVSTLDLQRLCIEVRGVDQTEHALQERDKSSLSLACAGDWPRSSQTSHHQLIYFYNSERRWYTHFYL